MKRLILSVVATVTSTIAFADTVTFTWKGGDGNWSDPKMWTASDGSTDRYPNAETDVAVFSPDEIAEVTMTEDITVSNAEVALGGSKLCFVKSASAESIPKLKLIDNAANHGQSHNWSLTFDGVSPTFGSSVWTGQSFYPWHNCRLTIKNKAYMTLYRISFGSFKETPTSGYTVPTNFVIDVGTESTFHIGSFAINGKNAYFVLSNATLNVSGGAMDSSNNYQYYVYGDSKIITRRQFFTKNPATLNLSLPEEPYETELVKLNDNGADYTLDYTTINILSDSPALKTSASSNRVYRIFNWHGTAAKIKNIGIDPNCLTWKYNGKDLKPYMSVASSFDPEYQAGGAKYPQYIDFVLGPKPGLMLLLR